MRRSDGCLNCGETREIAARGLCFACYRQEARATERKHALADRHNPALRREQKKLVRGFAGILVGLSDLGVAQDDVLAIRRLIEPYLAPISEFLTPEPLEDEKAANANSEQNSNTSFTVHGGSKDV